MKALHLVIEMNEWTWRHFKADLQDVTPEEIDWRPLPQANTINTILKHLRVEAEWYLKSIEHGEQSPYHDTASVQQLTDSIPLDFERNLKALEKLYADLLRRYAGQRWPRYSNKPCSARSFRAVLRIRRIS